MTNHTSPITNSSTAPDCTGRSQAAPWLSRASKYAKTHEQQRIGEQHAAEHVQRLHFRLLEKAAEVETVKYAHGGRDQPAVSGVGQNQNFHRQIGDRQRRCGFDESRAAATTRCPPASPPRAIPRRRTPAPARAARCAAFPPAPVRSETTPGTGPSARAATPAHHCDIASSDQVGGVKRIVGARRG